jgi:hypothetical protein
MLPFGATSFLDPLKRSATCGAHTSALPSYNRRAMGTLVVAASATTASNPSFR